MENEFDKLLEAQQVDLQIDQLHANTKEYPKRIEQLKKEIADLSDTIDTFKNTISESETNRRNIESEITAERETLGLREKRLLDTKTNKEYTAVQHEIEQTKERIDNLETEDLEMMNELDSLKPKLEEAETLLKEVTEKNTAEVKELSSKYESIETDVEKLAKERDRILEHVSSRPRSVYNRLRKGKSNLAVVTVDPVKHSCRGCFKQLPPQKVLEIRRKNKLIFCENCGRILVWDSNNDQ